MKLLLILISVSIYSIEVPLSEYQYPYENPFLATMSVGLLKTQFKKNPAHKFIIESDFELPNREDTFYKEKDLGVENWIYLQEDKAPLVFIISGIGGTPKDSVSLWLSEKLYKNGYNVITIPSTYHWKFALSAVRIETDLGVVPTVGLASHEAKIILEVMRKSFDHAIKNLGMKSSRKILLGYSQGASQAAFASKLNKEIKTFDFERTILMNTPVQAEYPLRTLDNVWDSSIEQFKDLYRDELKEKIKDPIEYEAALLEKSFSKAKSTVQFGYVRRVFPYKRKFNFAKSDDYIDHLSGLEKAFVDKEGKLRKTLLELLIAYSFRETASKIIPLTQEYIDQGLLTGKRKKQNRIDESLMKYGFMDYFEKIAIPLAKLSGIPQNEMNFEANSFRSLDTHLRSDKSIYMIHNADDLLLGVGDLDYLKDVFKGRITIYPRGGHLGNIWFPQNEKDLLDILSSKFQ